MSVSGPKTTQDQTSNSNQTTNGQTTNNTNGQFTQSSTPNLPSWYSSFLSSIPTQMQGLSASLGQNATQPLYGAQQQANYQQGLNQNIGAQRQQLQSQLASQGALNSGRASQMNTALSLGGAQQLGNYQAQTPLLNAQNTLAQNQLLNSALSNQSGFTSPINAYGTTQTGNSSQTSLQDILSQLTGNSNGVGTSQQSNSLLGMLTNGLLSGGAGLLGGL